MAGKGSLGLGEFFFPRIILIFFFVIFSCLLIYICTFVFVGFEKCREISDEAFDAFHVVENGRCFHRLTNQFADIRIILIFVVFLSIFVNTSEYVNQSQFVYIHEIYINLQRVVYQIALRFDIQSPTYRHFSTELEWFCFKHLICLPSTFYHISVTCGSQSTSQQTKSSALKHIKLNIRSHCPILNHGKYHCTSLGYLSVLLPIVRYFICKRSLTMDTLNSKPNRSRANHILFCCKD